MFSHDEVIVAVASAPGGSGRAIVRLCGDAAIDCVRSYFVAASAEAGRSERASHPAVHVGTLRLPEFTVAVPCDLFVWPDERSYARQPTVELHLPGSQPIVDAALQAACRGGARLAKPGEFTLRAFLAGRLDLTQAEAVLGVVDAADQKQLDVALRQMAGGLAGPLQQLRSELLDLLAHLEAGLDFVEEPIEFISRSQLLSQLNAAQAAVQRLVEQTTARSDASIVPRVALVGEPNVGKSSLFNALVGDGKAIVSPIAGTTRDYLIARLLLDGVACDLIDTAGVEEPNSAAQSIAAAAQQFTVEQLRDADVCLFCIDGARALTERETAELGRSVPNRLVVITKKDLIGEEASPSRLAVSVATQLGIDELRDAIRDAVVAAGSRSGDVVAATAVRCRDSLRRASTALSAAVELVERHGGEELIAVEIRHALDELGQVVGAVYTDDILDRIFSRFCIGK